MQSEKYGYSQASNGIGKFIVSGQCDLLSLYRYFELEILSATNISAKPKKKPIQTVSVEFVRNVNF